MSMEKICRPSCRIQLGFSVIISSHPPDRQEYTQRPSQPQIDEAMLKTLEIRGENPSWGPTGIGAPGGQIGQAG